MNDTITIPCPVVIAVHMEPGEEFDTFGTACEISDLPGVDVVSYYEPMEPGTVVTLDNLHAVPPGLVMHDRDGYAIVRAPEGDWVLIEKDGSGIIRLDTDEIRGEDSPEGSRFLPMVVLA